MSHEDQRKLTHPLRCDRSEREIDNSTTLGLGRAALPHGNGGFVPCPDLLTEEEAIRYLRLDIDGPAKPTLTLRYYREKGMLKATRVGRRLRYRRIELDRLLEQLTSAEERVARFN